MIRKCLWDESHTYEAKEDDNYRLLCPECYFNIYKELYAKKYQWYDFIQNIEFIKIEHKIYELENEISVYKKKLESLKAYSKSIEAKCILCDNPFKVNQEETWRYACNECFKTICLPLKELYGSVMTKTIISRFKKEHGDGNVELVDIMKFAKEYCKEKYDI